MDQPCREEADIPLDMDALTARITEQVVAAVMKTVPAIIADQVTSRVTELIGEMVPSTQIPKVKERQVFHTEASAEGFPRMAQWDRQPTSWVRLKTFSGSSICKPTPRLLLIRTGLQTPPPKTILVKWPLSLCARIVLSKYPVDKPWR